MNRSEHQQQVDQFMQLAGQETPDKPCIPSEEVRLLRAKLIFEEALETIRGLGFVIEFDDGWDAIALHDLDETDVNFLPCRTPDLVEIVDGCCDLAVVATGTLSACGVSDVSVQREVNESNLRKFGPGGHRREDGKWMKPANWVPPAIAERLKEQA